MRKEALLVALLVLAACVCPTSAAELEPKIPGTFTVYSRMIDRDVTFRVDLDVPAGNGPFPAVIFLHGCGGMVRDRAPQNWRRIFRDWGFATLILESFTPRNWPPNICLKEPEIGWRGQNDRTAEAFGAARLLRSLSFIRRDAIALMGFSHGAGTVLWAARRDDGYWYAAGKGDQIERFNALIAVYPWCGIESHAFQNDPRSIYAPLLITTGEHDSVTPPELCRRYEAAHRPLSDGNIQLRVIAGAYHGFDSGIAITTVPLCGGLPPKCGVPTTIGHDENAFRHARSAVAEFLKPRFGVP